MSDGTKVSNVEMYIFDDIDDGEKDLQELTGTFGDLQVNGSVLEHRQIDDNADYKVRTVTQIMLQKVESTKRFRYATDRSKSDGIGVLLRLESNDFVFTSTNQELSEIYKEINSAV